MLRRQSQEKSREYRHLLGLFLLVLHDLDIRDGNPLEYAVALLKHVEDFIRYVSLHNDLVQALCVLRHRGTRRKAAGELFRRLLQVDRERLEAVDSSDMLALRPLNTLDRHLHEYMNM